MQHKRLNENSGLRSYRRARNRRGSDELSTKVRCWRAHFAGTDNCVDWEKKDYLRIPVGEQVEVAALMGDVAEDHSGKPSLHIHCGGQAYW